MVVRIPEKTVTCQKCGKKFTVQVASLMNIKHCWSCSSALEKLKHVTSGSVIKS